MKSISLYVEKDTWLTRMHPFTKLCYILTAVSISLITGRLWMFGLFIGISFVMLFSGNIIKKALPLLAFSFTILKIKISPNIKYKTSSKDRISKAMCSRDWHRTGTYRTHTH